MLPKSWPLPSLYVMSWGRKRDEPEPDVDIWVDLRFLARAYDSKGAGKGKRGPQGSGLEKTVRDDITRSKRFQELLEERGFWPRGPGLGGVG